MDRPRARTSPLRLAAALLAGLLPAAAAQDAESRRDFGFQPLEIHAFDNGTSRLVVTDLNGDGLDDVLFVNNHVSRLEILLRKPDPGDRGALPALDECFENRGMIVDQALRALRVADFDGDGRPDIATFGPAIGLQIHYQREDGSFGGPERVFLRDPGSVATIQAGDLDGNGRPDILVCRGDHAEILLNTGTPPFRQRKTLTFSGDKCYHGDIVDLNGDGIPDLAFHFNTPRFPLRVRYGKGNGLFGIEQPVDLPPRHYANIMETGGEAPEIGLVLRNRLAFRLHRFVEKAQPPLLEAQEAVPARIGLEGTGRKSPPAWLAADFDGDGYDDLLVAAPELSRLHLYAGGPEGLDPEPRRIDSLSEVDHISRLANGDLLVASRKERIAALHSADDLDRFPAILKAPGDVLAAGASGVGNEAWLVCRNQEKQLLLVRMPLGGGEGPAFPLALRNEPSDLMAFQLPGGRTGLLLFMPYDTPKMQVFDGTAIEEVSTESFRALSQVLVRSNVRTGAPGDGTELVVAQGALARRFEWRDGRYEVVRQYNPENPRAELVASCGYALLDGSSGTLLYDRNAGALVHFCRDGDSWGKIQVPEADPTIFDLVQPGHPARDVVVLLDRTGLSEILGGGVRLDTVPAAEYVSDAENPTLAFAKPVRLGAPPRPMVALVDPANAAIELVGLGDGELERELAFKVFLASDFAHLGQARGVEPHDVESGDLNGDGIGDLVVLSHDKLLVYLGE